MNELEDIKLSALLNEMKLEAPGTDFSIRVMNKIFKENLVLEKIKSEKVLGKGFWIISILFILLFVVVFLVSNSGIPAESQISNLLPQPNNGIATGYQTFFDKIGAVPLSVVGILIASSTLLFIERIITLNSKIFSI